MGPVLDKEKTEFKGIVKYAYKEMGRAIADYHMVSGGDRVLIGLSGGMSSLSLLTLFKMRQKRIPIDFEIMACFVATNFIKVDKQSLTDYCNSLGVKLIIKELKLDEDKVNCFWCSWKRRKVIFETAAENNYNKIALGHNLDDSVETILLNLFFNGEISAMKPKVELFNGKLTELPGNFYAMPAAHPEARRAEGSNQILRPPHFVQSPQDERSKKNIESTSTSQLTIIRPLTYLDKKQITYLGSKLYLPVSQYQCAYGKDSKRILTRDIIKKLEKDYPFVKKNIFGAMGRIRKDYLL